MKNISILFLFSMVLLATSCTKKAGNADNVVTRRIQYDVTIKSPDPEFDWWVQNIEGAQRESFIQHIITAVSEGHVKAYDFMSNRLLTDKDIKNIMHRVDSISLESPDPPHELYDTVISQDLNLKNITRVRFLEEWIMDEKTLAFTKKVAGICPLLETFTGDGEFRGYKPLFWVYFDEQYPGKLLTK